MRASPLLLVLGGCNGLLNIPPASALEPDAPEAPPPGIGGIAMDTYWQSSSNMTLPRDMTQWQVSALVPDPGAVGGFAVYPGAGTKDGMFTVPGVPDGVTFMLKVVNPTASFQRGTQYFVSNSRQFDLSVDVLGRPDPALTTMTTNIVLNLENLKPYQDTDFLEVFCVNNAGAVFNFTNPDAIDVVNPPDVNANALSATTFDWSQPLGPGSPRNPLINGDRGDTISIIQESSQVTPNGVTVATIARVYSERFNQIDGMTHVVNGAFAATTPSLTLDPTIKRTLFEAHRQEVNPKVLPLMDYDYGYGDSLLPAPNGHAQFGATLDIAVAALPAGTTDLAIGAFSYADPFPADWEHLRLFRIQYYARFAVDNGAPSAFFNARWYTQNNLVFGSEPLVDIIEPTISPVRHPMVNGSDAFVGGTVSATRPVVVSWSPPSVGTPAKYWVVVYRAFNDAGKTRFSLEATIFTTATEVTMPPELVPTGSHRIFVIYAQSSNDEANSQRAPAITDVWKVM